MFVNANVAHQKYGKGIVTDVEINDIEELKSKVTVSFDSGEVKKFNFETAVNFLTGLEAEAKYVDGLKEEALEKAQKKLKLKVEALKHIPAHKYDEDGELVTLERWQRALAVADDPRAFKESRAVIMNDESVFINASAGCRHIGLDHRSATGVYKACEGYDRGRFNGEDWTYASSEVLSNLIKRLEAGEER